MNKKSILLLIIIVVSIVIVGNHLRTPFNVVRKDGEIVSSVPTADSKMQSIIQDARKTVPDFLKAFSSPASDESDFMIKYPFDTDSGSKYSVENMWISGIYQKDNNYFGVLINSPFEIKKLKLGDVVDFDIAKISDWKYEKSGKIIGGKSIKYLIENIPEAQRTMDEKEYLKLFK